MAEARPSWMRAPILRHVSWGVLAKAEVRIGTLPAGVVFAQQKLFGLGSEHGQGPSVCLSRARQARVYHTTIDLGIRVIDELPPT